MSKFNIATLQSNLSSLANSHDLQFNTSESVDPIVFAIKSECYDIYVDITDDNAIVRYESDFRTDINECDSNEHILEKVHYFL